MNLYVLLLLLATGACAVYDIDVSTLEKPTNEFHNSDLSSELRISPYGLDEVKIAGAGVPFLGTNFFQGPRKNCFSLDDTALMTARKDFDVLVPKSYPSCLSSDSAAHMLIRYWSTVNQVVHLMSDARTRRSLEHAFYDTLGGYLRFYLVPAAQISFYAGRLNLNTVERLVSIKRECQAVLHTNGNGWRAPSAKDLREQLKDAKIEPIRLGDEEASNCEELDLSGSSQESDLSGSSQESDLRGSSQESGLGGRLQESGLSSHSQESGLNSRSQELNLNSRSQESGLSDRSQESGLSSHSQYSDPGKITMPLPYLDPVDANGHLSNMFLPFRQHLIYDLRSPNSAFELVRFFRTITGCHRFLGLNQANYNSKLLDWVREIVQLHLGDEQFYPGLGGILQIQESLLMAKESSEEENRKQEDSSKLGRSIDQGKVEGKQENEDDDYMTEWLFVPASLVLMVLFFIIILCLHCDRGGGGDKRERVTPMVPDDVESALSSKTSRPRRAKRDKKERTKVKVEKSPLRSARDRHYYGLPSRSSDDYSSSTLGFQFKEKVMPIRFEGARGKARGAYKYSPVSSDHNDRESSSGNQDKKRSGRGK